MENSHNTERRQRRHGAEMPQTAMGRLIKRQVSQKSAKGSRSHPQYWVYVPKEIAEDKSFPFRPNDRLLITVVDGRVTLEKA